MASSILLSDNSMDFNAVNVYKFYIWTRNNTL